jgi:hypothetical protein
MQITPFLRENGTQTFQARLRLDGLHLTEQLRIFHVQSNDTPVLNLK